MLFGKPIKKDKKIKKDDPSKLIIRGEYSLSNVSEENLITRKKALKKYLYNEGFYLINLTGVITESDFRSPILKFYKKSLLKSNIKINISDKIEAFFKNHDPKDIAFFNAISNTREDLPAEITVRFTPTINIENDDGKNVSVEIVVYPIIYLKYSHLESYQDHFHLDDLAHYSTPSIELAKNIGASLNGIIIHEPNIQKSRNIFVVHGRDEAKKTELRDLLIQINTDPIILQEQPFVGKTVLDQFEHYANSCSFALILMTGDDFGGSNNYSLQNIFSSLKDKEIKFNNNNESCVETRARQNVITEFGYFWGRLGLKKIRILCEEGVKKPSDIDAILYIKLDDKGLWKRKIAEELDNQGIKIDMNLLDPSQD